MFLSILFVCLVQGFVTGEDDISEQICYHLYPDEMESFVIPDADLLRSVCPKMIDYFECEKRILIEENSDIHPSLNGIIDVVKNICEEDSKFQKEYLASVDCFRNLENNVQPCHEAAQSIYLNYRLFITRFDVKEEENTVEEQYDEGENKDESITYEEPYCMMTAYAVGCLGTQILDTCGQRAQETFVEIIQRSKVLTQYCSKEEGDKLRSEFLDYLTFEKEHSHIPIFRDVFDFKRKK